MSVTVEVFMLCDLTMFLIFLFLISFIMSLDVYQMVSTEVCKHNVMVSTHSSGAPRHVSMLPGNPNSWASALL